MKTALVDRQIKTRFSAEVAFGMKTLRHCGWTDEQIAEVYACHPFTVLAALGGPAPFAVEDAEAREGDGHGA